MTLLNRIWFSVNGSIAIGLLVQFNATRDPFLLFTAEANLAFALWALSSTWRRAA